MSKIKVAIDMRAMLSGHKTRGVGYYLANLLEQLHVSDEVDVIEAKSPNDFTAADIVHYPVFDLFQKTLPIFKPKPVVVTIHDVTPLIFPQAYPPGIKGMINLNVQKLSLKNVKGVITDSKSSMDDIHKYLGIKKDLITPIYLASSAQFRVVSDKEKLLSIKEKYDLPDEYGLYVGNVNWNKNIYRIAVAAVKVGVVMVFVGKGFEDTNPRNHSELQSYRKFLADFQNSAQVRLLGFVPDEDLVGVLNLSKMCLFPSLYEGFGLPILEAQACGVPVITSQVSSMPEVAGEGALYVDPEDVSEISEAMMKIIENPSLAREIVKKGFENQKKFSWQKTAQATIDVYTKVYNNSH